MVNCIIIGAGSAGCVLAGRLSEDPARSILLLEAGGADDNPEIRIPGRYSRLLGSDIDWSYRSEPQKQLNNRRIDLNRGKVVGGTTAINGMVYLRGSPRDFDHWAELGNRGWGWGDIRPFFQKAEGYEGPLTGTDYSADGPLAVTQIQDVLGQMERFIAAGEQTGLERNENFNGQTQDGVGPYLHDYRNGERQTLADAYLKPALGRHNLSVQTFAHVTRILFEGNRSVGVEYIHDNRLKQVKAGEVILCGGAINSPQVLLCSGIGPADHLHDFGLPFLIDLHGVGENLQDHPLLHVRYETIQPQRVDISLAGSGYRDFVERRTGPLVTTRTFAGAFWRTQPDLPAPDMQVFFAIDELEGESDIAFSLCLMRPQGRGHIRLQSAYPFVYPAIQPNYLDNAPDMQIYVDSVRMVRHIVGTEAFEGFVRRELAPGPDAQSDTQIVAWICDALVTTWHYSVTCKMGNDPLAVVNERLQVHGVEGLRVVDASVMPTITTGNINAPVIMIAEKAADLIRTA